MGRTVGTFLDNLLDDARRRVAEAAARESLTELRGRAMQLAPAKSFVEAISTPGVSVIAEVKRASPSKGDLAPGMDAVAQARNYVEAGVAAISVLTEPDRFKGSLGDLEAVSLLPKPTIRKDFVVDEYQVWEARAAGAAAVLLIVAALSAEELQHLSATARLAGLQVLVEVHDDVELSIANQIAPRMIGVNARDLRTFDVDRNAFARLRPMIPEDILAVAESGIRGPLDVVAAGEAGADAVLVGEALVTAQDPLALARELVLAGTTIDDGAGA